MARIAVAGFQHETNTFAAAPATFADFERPDAWPGLTRGADILPAVAGMNVPVAGAIAELQARGHEVVPIVWAAAGPCGSVTQDAYERSVGILLDGLAAAGPIDGVYLDLHGAMVAEHADDGDGETLRRVRAAVGDTPIVASLDLHANVSDRMLEQADGLVAYRTYPHLDMADTGARAARYLEQCLDAPHPARRLRRLPFLIPPPWQCSEVEPARTLYRRLAELEGEACLSFAMGFPPADVPECGPAVFAYGTDDAAVAAAVDGLAAEIEAAEADFAGTLWEPDAAVTHAIETGRTAARPVILADTQDNPGGGGPSNGTALLAELVRQGAADAVLGVLCDPRAAQAAAAAGVGATIDIELGTPPFAESFHVEAVGDGQFMATGPFYKGSHMQLGQMALLRLGGVRVAVSSVKQQAADQAMFRHVGVDPATAKILVLKSSVHFRADFGPLSEDILVVRAPGPNVADPAELSYEKLRRGVRLNPMGPVSA